jgi:adenine-specific DNA-methyltransferase
MIGNTVGNKDNGAYYTPSLLADFILFHIYTKYHLKDEINVLEPSAGDGVFLDSIFADTLLNKSISRPSRINVDAIELDKGALRKLRSKLQNYTTSRGDIKLFNDDYLAYHSSKSKKYDLIVGNPPYIRSNRLEKDQIEFCTKIHKKSGLSTKKIKNIWTSFLVGSVQALKDDGVMCFVLPAELLQVSYAKELRDFLKANFQRIEIFAFNELIFPNIEQDVVVLICTRQNPEGVSFYHVEKLEDLKKPEYVKEHTNIHRKTLDKWTNYILSDEELKFLDKLKSQMLTVKDYCRAEVGIVTAANDYFILSKKDISHYGLESIARPIIQKGMHLTPGVMYTKKDAAFIRKSGKPCYFLEFKGIEKANFDNELNAYLQSGIKSGINLRYKCQLRNHWYKVPSIWVSDGFFTKRSNIYPRTIVNHANILVTDSFYRIKMHEGFKINDFVFSFYNSLTLILAELEGRYYGGSVLEVMPNEFKKLFIPYRDGISIDNIAKLDELFRADKPITQILEFTNPIVLGQLGIADPEIEKLNHIYYKLVNRRLKGKHKNKIGPKIT